MFAAVVPSEPGSDAERQGCWKVFRQAAREAFGRYPVDVPPLQDERALERAALTRLLQGTGFTSIDIAGFSASLTTSVDDAVGRLMSTYMPDLLPPEGYAWLEATLRARLRESASGSGLVPFTMESTVITAHRHF